MFREMTKIVPVGKCGRAAIEHSRNAVETRCCLRIDGVPMMNDGEFERVTNVDVVRHAHGRVLIAGLGLGMILWPIVEKPEVTEVIVVEKSPDVIALVGSHVPLEKVRVLEGDITMWRPEPWVKFDTIWFDVLSRYTRDRLRWEFKHLLRPFLAYLSSSPDRWMSTWQRTALREATRVSRERRAKLVRGDW